MTSNQKIPYRQIGDEENNDNNNDEENNLPQQRIQQSINLHELNELNENENESLNEQEEHEIISMAQPAPSIGSLNPKRDSMRIDYPQYFKMKLLDPRQNCCCDGCHLWLAVHVWLILYLLIYILSLFAAIFNLSEHEDNGPLHIVQTVWSVICLIVNIRGFYGLYKCIPSAIISQLIVVWMNVVLDYTGVIMRGDYGNVYYIMMYTVSIVLTIWASWVFWRVWKWARYFANGGGYDANVMNP